MMDSVRGNPNLNCPFVMQATGEAWFGLSDSYKKNFGAVFSGSVLVQKGGSWEFSVASSDPVMLTVNGKPVVEGSAGEGIRSGTSRTRSGMTELTPGWHAFRLAFASGSGGNPGLQVYYKGPDDDAKQVTGMLQNLHVAFEKFTVLRPVNLSVAVGSKVCSQDRSHYNKAWAQC